MLIVPHTLALLTTYRCTAACEHCCFSCSPKNEQEIPTERLHQYIEQATEIPSLRVVVFTGGECFLLGRRLDELVKAASDCHFFTRFVSNAYWATSRKTARKRLETLKKSGLKEANYSTGEQHARFVGPENVRHAAMAAAELGLTSLVVVDSFGDSRFDFDAFVDEPEFKSFIEAGKVLIKVSPWMRFDGQRRIAYTQEQLTQLRQQQAVGPGCSTVLKVIGVTPTQEMCVCCGLTLERIPEMWVGSLKERTIRQVLTEAPDDFIKIWLHLYGPSAVLRYARKLDATIRDPGQHAHPCATCQYIYKNERLRELVSQNPPPNMRDIVAQYANSLVMPQAEDSSIKLTGQLLRGTGDINQIKQVHRKTLFHPKEA